MSPSPCSPPCHPRALMGSSAIPAPLPAAFPSHSLVFHTRTEGEIWGKKSSYTMGVLEAQSTLCELTECWWVTVQELCDWFRIVMLLLEFRTQADSLILQDLFKFHRNNQPSLQEKVKIFDSSSASLSIYVTYFPFHSSLNARTVQDDIDYFLHQFFDSGFWGGFLVLSRWMHTLSFGFGMGLPTQSVGKIDHQFLQLQPFYIFDLSGLYLLNVSRTQYQRKG